ncbi:MAG: bifunctional hydroxymethylpyrimidine kinase/phosphomethylpyrimidine kinase [Candidatus Berkiella sp.]
MRHKCLSIAGFDGSGGAGIQADLKTFSAFGCYGMSVLTALPVQNTIGVRRCYTLPLQCIEEQMHAIFEDIVPCSIKIGMLFSVEIIQLIAHFLGKYAKDIPIVLDPVMLAKSGDALLQVDAIDALKQYIIPLSTIVTPNLPEAHELTGCMGEMPVVANVLLSLGASAVLLKGGDTQDEHANDFYLDNTGKYLWLKSQRLISNNTHGTGCTLSAAIASCLALGKDLPSSCQIAKHYLFHALQAAQLNSVGKGHGPVHHFYHIWPTLQW